MDEEINTIKYKWEIYSLILSCNTRVCSNPFSNSKNLSFDISIERDPQNLIYIHVRKSDPRLGSAVITVELAKIVCSGPNNITISNCIRKDKFSNVIHQNEPINCFHLTIKDNVTDRRDLNDWKEVCSFKFLNFSSRASPNYSGNFFNNTVSSDYCIKNIIVNCTIAWRGFTKPELQKAPSALQPFFKAEEFSDVVLVVDNHDLPAHKIILSAHSPYFHAMFTTDMKERKENRVKIQNFTVDLITEMLEYFYTNRTKASEDVDVALQMVPVADMYDIANLKDICEATLLKNISLKNVLTILCAADDHNLTKLRNRSVMFMKNNKHDVVKSPDFEKMFYDKPRIMYEFTYAMATS